MGWWKRKGFHEKILPFLQCKVPTYLGEQSKQKNSQIVEKVHNFDDPTSTEIWKNWNVDYFDIVAPPLTIAKTVPKSYQTDTWGLFYSYKGHICTKCCIYLTNTSPIYHKNQGHISVIWIWEKSEKFRPPPSVKVSLHLKCRLFWFWRWPFWTFSTIWDIFLLLPLDSLR